MNKWVLLLIYLMVSIIYLYIWGFRTELGNYELIAVIISSTIAAVTYKKRTGKIFTVVLIITLIILAPIANSFNEKIIAEDYEKTLQIKLSLSEEGYNKGLEILNKNGYITSKEYEDANKGFSTGDIYANGEFSDEKIREAIYEKCPNVDILALYTKAMTIYSGDGNVKLPMYMKYEDADRYMSKIPDDYNGMFSEKIKVDKEKVKKKIVEAKGWVEESAREAAQEKANNLYIGDSESKMRSVLGKPESVNVLVTSRGEEKQNVYSGNRYVYTLNGIVTAMQNIEHQY